MSLALLLDEMVEYEVKHRLENLGHDVVHVTSHNDVGSGDRDRTLAEYSRDSERIVVSYDPDWVEELSEDEFYLDTARESRPSREGRVFRRSVGTED